MEASGMETPIGFLEGIVFREDMVPVDAFVWLRVMVFEPQVPQGKGAVLFVAGWISSIFGWASLVEAMARTRTVYYIETREKTSALIDATAISSDQDFSIARSAQDLITVCKHYGIDTQQTLAFGSSLGAMTIIEALKGGRLEVGAAFLVGPSSELRVPSYLLWVLSLPVALFHPLKRFIIWYLHAFRVDAKREPEQMRRYENAINMAEPKRLKHSARATILGRYRIWEGIETVKVPIAIAYAVSDKLHSHEDIERIAQNLPLGRLNPCPSNLYMHAAALLDDIEAFAASLEI